MTHEFIFSNREEQVANLLVQGKSNKEMAVELGISISTVEFHLSNIYKKLDISSRTEAVIKLTKEKLGESIGVIPLKAIVTDLDETSDNGEINLKRRFSMKYVITVVVTLLVVIGGFLIITNLPFMNDGVLPADGIEVTEDLSAIDIDPTEILSTDDLQQTEIPMSIDYDQIGGYGPVMEGILVDGDDPRIGLVNKDMHMESIREVLGQPELELVFDSYRMMPNAAHESISRDTGVITAVFKSAYFTFYVDIESGVLSLIQLNSFDVEVASNLRKEIDELREIATDFAIDNSFMFLVLEDDLFYYEGCESNLCIFHWATTKTWEGVEWRMNSVYIEIRVSTDGEIISYINTLDLIKP